MGNRIEFRFNGMPYCVGNALSGARVPSLGREAGAHHVRWRLPRRWQNDRDQRRAGPCRSTSGGDRERRGLDQHRRSTHSPTQSRHDRGDERLRMLQLDRWNGCGVRSNPSSTRTSRSRDSGTQRCRRTTANGAVGPVCGFHAGRCCGRGGRRPTRAQWAARLGSGTAKRTDYWCGPIDSHQDRRCKQIRGAICTRTTSRTCPKRSGIRRKSRCDWARVGRPLPCPGRACALRPRPPGGHTFRRSSDPSNCGATRPHARQPSTVGSTILPIKSPDVWCGPRAWSRRSTPAAFSCR